MDKIEYKGEIYTRTSAKWVDDRHLVVHESLQRELNKAYLQTVDLSTYSVEELVCEGDKFRDSSSYSKAIVFYEYAAKECDLETLSYILPRISACYRKCNTPRKTIELFSDARKKYGADFITPVLLTSVAAAYCDLGEYDNALRCCKWAYARFGGEASQSLHNVFSRIKKESGLE